MKNYFLLLALLLMGVSVSAQQKDISVFEKKEGDKNIVIARNTGKVPYLVTLNIRATGMDVVPGIKAEAIVQPGFMKEVATLTPKPGMSWTYGYDVSYIQYNAAAPPKTQTETIEGDAEGVDVLEPAVVPDGIIVYSKPGCGRCTMVKNGLKDKGIKYTEIDITSGDPRANEMWKSLRDGGFTGESVTMPVVRANGKLHYNIKDLNKFMADLK